MGKTGASNEKRVNGWPAFEFSELLNDRTSVFRRTRRSIFSSCPMTSPSKSGLVREFGRGLKALFWMKSIGVPVFMYLFFLGYLYILKHAVFPVTVMPLTRIDRMIPYQTGAWLLYVSLWIYVQVPLCLIDRRRELVLYGWVAAVVSLIGFGVFILWPTAVPANAVEPIDSLFAGIRQIDTTGNSCPSLHVAFSVFTAAWLERFLRKARISDFFRWLNVAWCLGIVYSTLATKQHVMLDACAGAALGLAGAALQAHFERRYVRQTGLASIADQPAQISPAARKL